MRRITTQTGENIICPARFNFPAILPNADRVISIISHKDSSNILPPSSYHAIAGATVCLNLSASNELVAKADYRTDLIKQQSARCISGYVYASSGVNESTTDVVFGGHALIAENGSLLKQNERLWNRIQDIGLYADT